MPVNDEVNFGAKTVSSEYSRETVRIGEQNELPVRLAARVYSEIEVDDAATCRLTVRLEPTVSGADGR